METDTKLSDVINFTLHPNALMPDELLYCNHSDYSSNVSSLFCNVDFDGLSCWPATLAGTTARVPCFSELNGVKYDLMQVESAFRMLLGQAGPITDHVYLLISQKMNIYRAAQKIHVPFSLLAEIAEGEFATEVLWDMRDAVTVYYVGYGLSLVALTLALWIFIYFKDLRCLRNTIHANLMFTYLLLDITWILTARLQSSQNHYATRIACVLTIFLTYLMGTNFFWMFVEGLYLFILVVKTFSVDNIKISIYAVVGWIFPAMIAATWAGVKGHFSNIKEDILSPQECPWQKRDFYDYIFITPVILVLMVNIIFLTKIMWVLITKLRATNTVESEQYRKAAKALLVLIPLLGVTYILVIATPSHRTGEVVFTFIQATLLSIQGFIVAVLYCFLNGEVQNSVKHRIERWQIRRAINRGQHQSLSCRSSPRMEQFYRDRRIRDSCVSFATSTSFVNFAANAVRSPSVPQVNKLENCYPIIEPPPIGDDVV